MDRIVKGLRTLIKFWLLVPKDKHPLTIMASLFLIALIIIAISVPSVRNQVLDLAGMTSESQKNEPGIKKDDVQAESETLSKTWRVFFETKTTPVFDLSFTPNGKATWLMEENDRIKMSVSAWEYTEKGDSVEVSITLRTIDNKVGVDYPQKAWLHLKKDGAKMHGSYEQQIIGYDIDGTPYDQGVHKYADKILAIPKN